MKSLFAPIINTTMGAFATAAVALGAVIVITLSPGSSATVQCTGDELAITQDGLEAQLACIEYTPTPTEVPPVPTATPTATPTTTTEPQTDIDLMWHEPGIAHGDRPAHEHGDAPPMWVLDAGYTPTFTHVGGTPGENVAFYKHTAFKGWAGRFGDVDWYGVFHLDTNPIGQHGRFHSYQLWFRDSTGAVSHMHGWLDFGTGDNAGPNRIVTCGQDSSVRPIILVNEAGCPVRFENWYARGGGSGDWAPDVGFNINPTYFNSDTPNDLSSWQPIGGYPNNLTRRIEFAWYADRSDLRGDFWTTQWGSVVSGPNDPVCGTGRTIGGKSYTVLCLMQHIEPTLPTIQFPGNSVQRTFPDGDGVAFPN